MAETGMTRKRRRLYMVSLAMLALAAATALVLTAFEDNLVFFYGPSELEARGVKPGQRIRVGGLVEAGSIERKAGAVAVSFRITDLTDSIKVTYSGMLPDLFREEQGVVAEGVLRPDGSFEAHEVLAKHDENYMPPEVAEALKKSGRWQSKDTK
jgi:cytochrome c-type biogenesis protein CcmE